MRTQFFPRRLAPDRLTRRRAAPRAMPQPTPPRPPDSTLLFRIMNPELFYAVPKPVLALGAAIVAVACANTARLVLAADPQTRDARVNDDDDGDDE